MLIFQSHSDTRPHDYASLVAVCRCAVCALRSRCVHPQAFSRVPRALAFASKNPNAMSKTDPWVVHKFGGSSVADADCFRRVAAIIESLPATRVGVVLSACRGVTDGLLPLVGLAARTAEG